MKIGTTDDLYKFIDAMAYLNGNNHYMKNTPLRDLGITLNEDDEIPDNHCPLCAEDGVDAEVEVTQVLSNSNNVTLRCVSCFATAKIPRVYYALAVHNESDKKVTKKLVANLVRNYEDD